MRLGASQPPTLCAETLVVDIFPYRRLQKMGVTNYETSGHLIYFPEWMNAEQ
jgi:hypothetical protein